MSQSDFVTRGQALVSSGQYQEAVKVCRLGLLGRPTTVEGRIVLGQALLALKRHDEVLAEMRVALELDHTSHAALALKGEALLRKGDAAGALEVLAKLRSDGVAHAHIAALLGEAERLASRVPPGNASPVGFLAQEAFAVEPPTKHYPAHLVEQVAAAAGGGDDTGSQFTRPTSLAAPSARKRATPGPEVAPRDATPSPSVLAVGDRSGTLEVDPDRDGIEEIVDDDFGDVVGPPVADGPDLDAVTVERDAPRAPKARPDLSGIAATLAARKAQRDALFKEEVSTVELDDQVIRLGDQLSPEARRGRKLPGPGTAVRNAVKMPSGPIDQPPVPSSLMTAPVRPVPSSLMTAPVPPMPPTARPSGSPQPAMVSPQIAQMLASPSYATHTVPASPPPSPRGAIAAALPTAAAMPMPLAQPAPVGHMPAIALSVPVPPPMPAAAMPMALPLAPGPIPAGPPALHVPQSLPLHPPGAQSLPHHLPVAPFPPVSAAPPAPLPPPPNQPPMPPQAHAAALRQTLVPGQHLAAQSAPAHIQAVAQAFPAHLPSSLAAIRPTIALSPGPQPAPATPPFNGQDGQPAWARATVVPGTRVALGHGNAGASEPAHAPHEVDPQVAAMLAGQPEAPAAYSAEPGSSESKSQRTARRGRTRLQILLWVMIGAAVIGGGVFAGFQIRAMRLGKQIAAARDLAVDLARADTWQGWLGARESLAKIVEASPTPENRAALARARAVLAYEFGDGTADARAAVDRLSGRPSLDLDIASAYLALAQSDLKTARDTAERAQQTAPEDAAALYVSGQAALLAGDLKGAIADLRRAVEREPRPLYAVALARALGASSAWDEALATVDRAGDNPAAVIAKAGLLAAAGRIAPGAGAGQGAEVRAQLAKVIAEGQKPGEPSRVSPTQVAFAGIALAQLEFARNEPAAARTALRASLDAKVTDQRFAEEVSEALYAIGDLETARKSAALALDAWPASRRARTTLAQVWLALGKPAAALDLFSKAAEAASSPRAQTVRGQARVATGDVDGARADFDAALKKLPGYEPALIARTWLDLASGDLDDARQRIASKFNPKTATVAMIAVHAAIQRASGDAAARDRAKALLVRAVAGPPSLEVARAQLELARIDRDAGDFAGARDAYAAASRSGNYEARLEAALLQIDQQEPRAGRDALEQLLKDVGEQPSASLLLETARARMLMGDHPGAGELLALADKVPGVVRWQFDRERARLALRKNDTAFAAQALVRALDGCGGDLDTFLLAADTLSADDQQLNLATKLRGLMPARLKGRPEIDIINGKLELAAGKRDDAERVYRAARDALVAANASKRRLAQATYGLAAVAYEKEDDPNAMQLFELVMIQDPSIFGAYLFASEISRTKKPRRALELAQQAAALNPDSLDAWKLVGTLAAQLNHTKALTDKGKLLDDAIARVKAIAPGSETLRQLQSLHQAP